MMIMMIMMMMAMMMMMIMMMMTMMRVFTQFANLGLLYIHTPRGYDTYLYRSLGSRWKFHQRRLLPSLYVVYVHKYRSLGYLFPRRPIGFHRAEINWINASTRDLTLLASRFPRFFFCFRFLSATERVINRLISIG